MAINPGTTPAQFEYRPLNLMAFAAPLSKMQEEFDLVSGQVNTTDFDLAHLPYGTDPERAKQLLASITSQRDELSKNLLETKNYKQAAVKLKKLNDLWKKDPELKALQSNYAQYQDMIKTAKENVKSEYWDQAYADQWLNRSKREYEGANFKADFDNPEGTYNTYGRNVRGQNLAKEFEELSFKIAKEVSADKIESMLKDAGVDMDTQDKMYLQTTVEKRDASKVAEAVRGYLQTIPRFKEWGLDVAEYNFDDLKQNPAAFNATAERLNSKYIQSLDAEIAAAQKAAKKDKSILESQGYKDMLEEKELAAKSQESGNFDAKAIQHMYNQEHLGKMYNMDALGKVFAYKKSENKFTFRKLDDGSGDGSGGGLGAGDGAFNPLDYDVTDFNSLLTQKTKVGSTLYPTIKEINDIAGGAMRTLSLGAMGTASRKQLEKNPDQMIARQQQILGVASDLLSKGKGVKEFTTTLKKLGFQVDPTAVAKVWGELSNPESMAMTSMKNNLEKIAPAYNDYVAAKEQITRVKNIIQEDPEYKALLKEVSSSYPGLGLNKEQAQFFNGVSYTQDQLKRAGVIVPKGRSFHQLTFEEVAKLNGFKSFKEAVDKNFDFKGVPIATSGAPGQSKIQSNLLSIVSNGASVQQALKEINNNIVAKNPNKLQMSFAYINDPKMDKYLNGMFLNSGSLTAFQPAKGTWQGAPGFTEEGALAPGTSLDLSGTRAVKMVRHGNDIQYLVPYSYRDEDSGKKVETTIKVKPKIGMDAYTERALKYAIRSTATGDKLSQATNDMAWAALFDNTHKTYLSQPTFDATVTQNKKPAVVASYPTGTGANVEFVKEWPTKGKPILKIYVTNSLGERSPIKVDANNNPVGANTPGAKDFYTEDVESAKTFIARNSISVD
jgi:hypothetical protein